MIPLDGLAEPIPSATDWLYGIIAAVVAVVILAIIAIIRRKR